MTDTSHQEKGSGSRGIEVEGLEAGFGETLVVDGVSFQARVGELLAIVGHGGSGKSTLVRALGIGGEGLWRRARTATLGLPLMVQPQNYTTVQGTLRSLLEAGGPDQSPESLIEAAWDGRSEAVEQVRSWLDLPIGQLQPPWKARLALFTACAVGVGGVRIFDEPDADAPDEVREWLVGPLRRLARHSAVILVSHHLNLVRRVADRVLLLVEGRPVEQSPVEEFFGRPRHPRTRQFLRYGS